MPLTTIARVPSGEASRYGQQCKHWSHSLEVGHTAERGTIRFPAEGRAGTFPGNALVTLSPEDDTLNLRVEASASEQCEAMKGLLARHLDRFAFREAPLRFEWRDEPEAG